MSIDEALEELSSTQGIKFKALLRICSAFFDGPRIEGSHHIFKTPWRGLPWINLQRDGKMAKAYQVKQVRDALKKLKEFRDGEKNEV